MSESRHRLDLTGLNGANPLGFLAALGTVATLSESQRTIRLGWHARARWTPFLESERSLNQESVALRLAEQLRGIQIDAHAESQREVAQRCLDMAKKRLKAAIAAIKERKLRGTERKAAWEVEIAPLAQAQAAARSELLAALKHSVPSPELALGQRPDCSIAEFREHADAMLREASIGDRTSVDLLAAFGAELGEGDDRIVPTPFCFITGSGHQWFLDTARQLMALAAADKVREALFQPWAYRDEKLTMRWDPLDDRRYALMDRDPTASDNKSATVWMANLLAYRALAFFPCAPSSRRSFAAGWDDDYFIWPLWTQPLSMDTIRSLMLVSKPRDSDLLSYRKELRARGVSAIFRARRIQVGNPPLHKINFSPGYAL